MLRYIMRRRRLGLLIVAFALLVLAAGSVVCVSAWYPTNLNETEGPGTATWIALILWPLVLVVALILAALGLWAVRLMPFLHELIIAAILSWLALFILGNLPVGVIVAYFASLNVGATIYVGRFLRRYA